MRPGDTRQHWGLLRADGGAVGTQQNCPPADCPQPALSAAGRGLLIPPEAPGTWLLRTASCPSPASPFSLQWGLLEHTAHTSIGPLLLDQLGSPGARQKHEGQSPTPRDARGRDMLQDCNLRHCLISQACKRLPSPRSLGVFSRNAATSISYK